MEKFFYVLSGLVFLYTLLKAISHKIYLCGILYYMTQKGYKPPSKTELMECSKAYLLSSFGIKN